MAKIPLSILATGCSKQVTHVAVRRKPGGGGEENYTDSQFRLYINNECTPQHERVW